MNIVWILTDTFRRDNLFGNLPMTPRTPELDRFAERAVDCSRMYLSSFPTIPHRTDLTSGRFGWPWHGWEELGDKNHAPRLLSSAGFASQLICDCPHLFPAGFDRGFTAAIALRGQEGDLAQTRWNDPIEAAMPPGKTRPTQTAVGANLVDTHTWQNRFAPCESERFAPRLADLVVEWLERNYQRDRLFLWVDFFDPHEPWDPPEYMVRRYDPDYSGVPMKHPVYGRSDVYTREELLNLRAHYCAEVEMVDRAVGRVLQKIDDLQMWDNSVVVFTSDHGVSLGEHDRVGKSNCSDGADPRAWPLYPEIAHVPCLIAAPGLAGGRRMEKIVQTPDILPTCADLAGVSADPPTPFHGRSFAPWLRDERGDAFRDFAIAGAPFDPDKHDKRQLKPPVFYTEKWGVAPYGHDGRGQVFDIEADPLAENDRAADHEDLLVDVRREIAEWLKAQDAPQTSIEPFL